MNDNPNSLTLRERLIIGLIAGAAIGLVSVLAQHYATGYIGRRKRKVLK